MYFIFKKDQPVFVFILQNLYGRVCNKFAVSLPLAQNKNNNLQKQNMAIYSSVFVVSFSSFIIYSIWKKDQKVVDKAS